MHSAGPMCTGKRQTHIRNAPSSRTAVTGIGLYGQAGKCIRIRRRFSIIRCILPGGAEPRPYQLRLHFNGFCVKQTVYGLKLMTLPCRGRLSVRARSFLLFFVDTCDKIKKEMEGSEELRNKIDIIKKKINPS